MRQNMNNIAIMATRIIPVEVITTAKTKVTTEATYNGSGRGRQMLDILI